jgi:hypothetical protein
LADEFFQWLGAGDVFLNVDAGFLAENEAEQGLENRSPLLGSAVNFAAVSNREQMNRVSLEIKRVDESVIAHSRAEATRSSETMMWI